MSTRTNIHGRRSTRGFRPWLLMPKVLSVTVYFGSTAAAAAVWFAGQPKATGGDAEARLAPANLVGGLLAYALHTAWRTGTTQIASRSEQ